MQHSRPQLDAVNEIYQIVQNYSFIVMESIIFSQVAEEKHKYGFHMLSKSQCTEVHL